MIGVTNLAIFRLHFESHGGRASAQAVICVLVGSGLTAGSCWLAAGQKLLLSLLGLVGRRHMVSINGGTPIAEWFTMEKPKIT